MNRRLARGSKNSYSRTEEESNVASGAGSDRGQHVYYSSSTEATGTGGVHRFKLKTEAWTLVIEKSPVLTTAQIKARLIPVT